MDNSILIVDDEFAIREMIKFTLHREGFNVLTAQDTGSAKKIIQKCPPQLLLLDIMLPGQSGMSFAKELRNKEATRSLPIIMLTAKAREEDKIRGLDIGADDYIIKPFSPKELVARIKALLRRTQTEPHNQTAYQYQDLHLYPESHEVMFKNTLIPMGSTEFKLLSFFVTHPERIFTRTQLLDYVWGQDIYIAERTVDVHIRRLRIALKTIGYEKYIQTVRGIGYRLSTKKTS